MTYEFIYQFQSFSQYRTKLKKISEDEINALKSKPKVWDAQIVFNYLHALIAKSGIVQRLSSQFDETANNGDANDFSSNNLYKMLGYFSIIGLLRVHCLLGDYYMALKVVESIDLSKKKGLFTRVTSCYITTYYYLGFAYLMTRRYVDAIKTFSNILLYISRTKHYHARSYQYEQLVKKNDQMYQLLAITVSLCPQRIDEIVHQALREKYNEKMLRMQRGDEATFEELFNHACPKFITPSIPPYDEEPKMNYHQEAYKLQLKLFLNEIRQQALLPTIRSYLKLYTTIEMAKLATFLDMTEDSLRTYLLCYKHKTRNTVAASGNKATNSSDVDFYIDMDMIHIADQKVQRRYGDYFIRHINKFEEIISDVEKTKIV